MTNDDIKVFVDELTYQDHYVIYNGQRIFFNGCQCEIDNCGKVISSYFEVYNLDNNTVIFAHIGKSQAECIEAMLDSFRIDGKSFFEAALGMEWIDG